MHRASPSCRRALAAAFAVAALVAAPARADSIQTQIDLAVCPNITTTTHSGPFAGPSGCGPPVFSAGAIFIPPDGSCTAAPPNTDLGSFLTTQNPLGASVHASGGESCATRPPERGAGVAEGGALTLSVAQTGFCPTTLTIPAQTGRYGDVVFPIGSLPLGSYRVSVSFPAQTVFDPQTHRSVNWLGTQASGTLRVGSSFTETETSALVRAGSNSTFAVLLDNSVAGPGAAELVSTRSGNIGNLTGTEYYACGTIRIAATVTYGKRRANGIVRLSGNGSITGGTGNYAGLTGTFTATGSYSTRTTRGTLLLKGTATY